VNAAPRNEVDAIGFVFASSVRAVTTQRANELAALARRRVACVAVTRHPSRDAVAAILGEFRPDILQTDIEDLDALDLPRTLSVLPVMRPGSAAACALAGPRVVRRTGEWQRANHSIGPRPPRSRSGHRWCWPVG
jgi:phosphoribosylanthranilate isomerase